MSVGVFVGPILYGILSLFSLHGTTSHSIWVYWRKCWVFLVLFFGYIVTCDQVFFFGEIRRFSRGKGEKEKVREKIRLIHLFCEPSTSPTTVALRFNEVPRNWGNLFVTSRVRYIENLHITNLWKNNQNVRYIEVKLIILFNGITLHYPAFADLSR